MGQIFPVKGFIPQDQIVRLLGLPEGFLYSFPDVPGSQEKLWITAAPVNGLVIPQPRYGHLQGNYWEREQAGELQRLIYRLNEHAETIRPSMDSDYNPAALEKLALSLPVRGWKVNLGTSTETLHIASIDQTFTHESELILAPAVIVYPSEKARDYCAAQSTLLRLDIAEFFKTTK